MHGKRHLKQISIKLNGHLTIYQKRYHWKKHWWRVKLCAKFQGTLSTSKKWSKSMIQTPRNKDQWSEVKEDNNFQWPEWEKEELNKFILKFLILMIRNYSNNQSKKVQTVKSMLLKYQLNGMSLKHLRNCFL